MRTLLQNRGHVKKNNIPEKSCLTESPVPNSFFMANFYGPEPSLTQLTLLLLGEKQSGKSSVGNNILGGTVFGGNTTRSTKKTGIVFGRQVTVVDTPGWSTRAPVQDQVSWELSRGLDLCRPGPHAILLVLPAHQPFSQVEWRAMEFHLRLQQVPLWHRTIVLFTHVDKLDEPIQRHIWRQGRTLQWLLDRCGGRYHIMSSYSSESQFQVTELLKMIQKMLPSAVSPTEIQRTHPGSDVSRRWEQRWYTKQQGIEMMGINHMHDGNPRQTPIKAWGWSSTPTGLGADLVHGRPAISLILLGRRRSGKSSVGNMILDKQEFRSNIKTATCSSGHAQLSRWSVTVVDTPGWSLFGLANPETVREELVRSPSLCSRRSKMVFGLAIPLDSFKEKNRATVEKYLSVLGANVWNRTVVLFTYGHILRGRTIDRYIKEKGEPLQWILDRCGHRYLVFDTKTGDKSQVNALMEIVDML
ncbi:GTPase IMAP family member 8 [Oryzias melastigma]|uniref:GTPase IMAP family member 8 n=1 Tax=Oryzias melastigma TaxID=30732 RepID=A0A834F4S9_ORYME|nr:GTPase IMAP family member 8 [Oryzias melastigma]